MRAAERWPKRRLGTCSGICRRDILWCMTSYLRIGNIDHIVISKKGILTVETKSHRGVVTCEGKMLKRDGKPFEKDFINQAWAEALSIRDLTH